jgi:hypothetical protein
MEDGDLDMHDGAFADLLTTQRNGTERCSLLTRLINALCRNGLSLSSFLTRPLCVNPPKFMVRLALHVCFSNATSVNRPSTTNYLFH